MATVINQEDTTGGVAMTQMNRAQRRRSEREVGAFPRVTVPTDKQTPEEAKAEEMFMAEAGAYQASPATTMAVLAHQWFGISQQREAARLTQERFMEMRKAGRPMRNDGILKQFADASAELGFVGNQIVDLLTKVKGQEGAEIAMALLGANHMNMLTEVAVRFPAVVQAQFALGAAIVPTQKVPEPNETAETDD